MVTDAAITVGCCRHGIRLSSLCGGRMLDALLMPLLAVALLALAICAALADKPGSCEHEVTLSRLPVL